MHNIQDVIRSTFKALQDVIKNIIYINMCVYDIYVCI